MSYRVYGRVRRSDNGQGIPNLTVRAYDVDWITSDDYLGVDTTDSSGNFDIPFARDAFDAGWFDPEGGPDIIIKVWNASGQQIYESSERSGAGKNTYFDIRINPMDLLGEYTLSGRIIDGRTGRGLCNLNVEAWDDDYVGDDVLGSDRTDINGNYLIPYTKSDFKTWWELWEGSPDPFIKVMNDDGRELASSSAMSGASQHAIINAVVGPIEISRAMSECIYSWTAAYRQECTHIVIRIRLDPDANVTNQQLQNLQNIWKTGIENKWSNHFVCCCNLKAKDISECRSWRALTFEVQWVTNNPHHTVQVSQGTTGTNMLLWHTGDSGDIASHEFGHMLGLVDEYAIATCPSRSPVNTDNVMDDNTEVVERHVEHLCQLLNGNAVPLPTLIIFPWEHVYEMLPPSKSIPPPAQSEMCGGNPMSNEESAKKIRKDLLKKVKFLAKGKAKATKKDKITHIVSGGVRGQQYESLVEILGNGAVSHTLRDEPKGLSEKYSTTLESNAVRNLFAEIASSGLLDLEDIGGGFLPDSIVGSITIEIDGKKTVYHYLADKEQRRNQKAILKQPVAIVHSSLKRVAQRAIKRDKALQRRIGRELKKGTDRPRPKPKKRSRKRGPKKL